MDSFLVIVAISHRSGRSLPQTTARGSVLLPQSQEVQAVPIPVQRQTPPTQPYSAQHIPPSTADVDRGPSRSGEGPPTSRMAQMSIDRQPVVSRSGGDGKP